MKYVVIKHLIGVMMPKRLIHEILGLNPGHFTIDHLEVDTWGSEITFDCIYSYPPDERPFDRRMAVIS